MVNMTFEKRIYEQEFKLNDTDDSIIEYIKNNRDNIQNLSIQSIAKALYIAPNAIMRTAKKLGYSGFSELKFSLQKEDHPEDTQTVQKRMFDRMPQNIIKTLDVIDESAIKVLVDKMINCQNMLFAGVGESTYFCELLGKHIRCLNRKVEYFQQIHDMEYAASHLGKDDLIVVISASGTVDRILNLAKKAKENGVEVFCITHFGKNPLSEICDGQICFWGEKIVINGYNVTDRSGLMMVVRTICEQYWKDSSCV